MMVSESILTELRFLLVALLSGAAMILFYDLFRVIRRVIAHGTVWTAVEDFIYWLCCALFVFAMLYRENDGLIRGFAIGGMAVGMLCYNRFVSPFFVKYMALILGTVFRILRRVAGILCRPLKKLKKILKKTVRLVKIGLCKL